MSRLAWFIAIALVAAPALAGPASFEAGQYHPSDTTGGYLAVDGASVAPHLGFTVGLWSTWAHRVLVLRDSSGAVPPGGAVIDQQLSLDLIGSLAILGRLELGIDLPYVPRQVVDNSLAMIPGGISSTGLGDLRIDLKVRAFTAQLAGQHRLLLAGVAGLRLPTGDSSSFLGQDGATASPRLVFEWRHPRASAAANFGAVLRSARSYGDLAVTHQLSFGAAARAVIGAGFDAVGELRGVVGVGLPGGAAPSAKEAPVELELGVVWRAPFGLAVTLAGGTGLSRGYGTPDGRVILGVAFTSQPKYDEQAPLALPAIALAPQTEPVLAPQAAPEPDRDRDGVPDASDRCPEQAGAVQNDGCPDVDSDGDGLIDRLDKCPFEAEQYNGNQDEDGCPDAGAPLLDVKVPLLVPSTPFDGASTSDEPARKLLEMIARLLQAHPDWAHLTVTCSFGRTDDAGECERRAEAVRRLLQVDLGVDAERLGTRSTRADERRHGFVFQFQIDEKIAADAPPP